MHWRWRTSRSCGGKSAEEPPNCAPAKKSSERSKLQEELIQSQKLESVGRLAGCVAHDFNNLLMGIMGYTDLCLDGIPEEHPIRHWLEEIARTSRHSANLTRQLLAFARKQIIAPKVIDLNDAITGILDMLQPLIGENIDISWIPGRDLWSIKMIPLRSTSYWPI